MRPTLLLVIALLCGCSPGGLGVADVDECIAVYAVPAGTKLAVNYAIGQCRTVFNPEATQQAKDRAVCLLPKLAESKSEQGARAAAMLCNRQAAG